jgi:hypothetical protein
MESWTVEGDSPVYEVIFEVLGYREVGRGTWNLV